MAGYEPHEFGAEGSVDLRVFEGDSPCDDLAARVGLALSFAATGFLPVDPRLNLGPLAFEIGELVIPMSGASHLISELRFSCCEHGYVLPRTGAIITNGITKCALIHRKRCVRPTGQGGGGSYGMASYRFSATVISRKTGRSALACAAYRAASRLHDERHGEVHDYTRKRGCEHAEIIAPEHAPEWVTDRERLWNEVEAAEKRKDAQLAREVQLSLPHELTAAQRLELVQSFVREEFVSRGMVADIAIHAPGREGDDRNHHAHVMLSMREIDADGFGKKAREWNDRGQLEHWREAWAEHQNRTLERHGHEARVDHRSLEDQGIDREPQQHMGPTASAMEQFGKASRIGEENREIERRNQERAELHRQAVETKLAAERDRQVFEMKVAYRQAHMDSRHLFERIDFEREQHRERYELERDLAETYGDHRKVLEAENQAIERRLERGGIWGAVRGVLGLDSRDERALARNRATLESIAQREAEARSRLAREHQAETAAFERSQGLEKDYQLDRIAELRRQKEERVQASEAEPVNDNVREGPQRSTRGPGLER